MKKTTAIIMLLVVLVIALAVALLYEIRKDDVATTPIPTPTIGEINISSGDGMIQIISSGEEVPIIETISGDETQDDAEESGDEEKTVNSGEVLYVEPEVAIVEEEVIDIPENDKLPIKEAYDLIVFGAEPEGIVASVVAARSGLKTLLVEKRDGPGGLFTYGMLNTIDMNTGTNGELLNKGVFEEFYKKIGSNNTFDVEEVKGVFEKMLNDEKKKLSVLYNVEDIEISVGQDKDNYKIIKYVVIDGEKYTSLNYIDCTQDADITAMAGAKYTVGWEDVNEKNRSMSATLVIKMNNVNWKEMTDYIDAHKTASNGYNNEAVWAFGEFTSKYVPTQPHMRLKALNIGKQKNGSVLINSLQIIDVNTLDKEETEEAYEKCKKEAESFAKFLVENVPGFSKATFEGVADELYIRETRHIVGEERLMVQDILESKRSIDDIAMGSYPIDVQTTSIYDWGYIIANPRQYYIPYGCIIPKGYSNILVCSRSASYSSIAAGSSRVVPTGMAVAEAGALASAMSKQRGISYQDIFRNVTYMTDLQDKIRVNGAYIDTVSKPIIIKELPYYSMIIEMCEKGILSLGYQNEFKADEIMSEADFIVLVKTYLKRSFLDEKFWNTDHINLLDVGDRVITPNRAKEIIYDITTHNIDDRKVKNEIENFLNIIIPQSGEELTNSRVYEILIGFKDFLARESL